MDDYTEKEMARTLDHEYAKTPLEPPKHSTNGHHGGGNGNGGNGGGGGTGGGGGGVQPVTPYEPNDTGNALRLLDAHADDMRFVVETDKFHVWTGNAWEEDKPNQVQTWTQELARSMWSTLGMPGIPQSQLSGMAKWALECGNMGRIRAAVAAAALNDRVKMHLHDFDSHDWLLPCANGLTYDLQTGTLRPSRRDDYMTLAIPVAASREPVSHPVWDALLRLVMADDAEMVTWLRRTLGMLLTGSVRDQTFYFWYGARDNGKTTLLRFLVALLGDYAYKIPLRALLEKRDVGGIRHDLADMRGKRLVYSEEFKPGNVLDEGVVKDITGGGDITADRKGENNITFRSTGKLIIATNTLPELRDAGPAVHKRMRAVPFNVNIPKLLTEQGLPLKDQDMVIAELLAEAPGIVQDLVAAVGEWRQFSRLPTPDKVQTLTEEYLVEQDPLAAWLDICCTADGKQEERPFGDWYWSFLEQSGRDEKHTTTNWFGRQLRAHGFVKQRTVSSPAYTGPALTAIAARALEHVQARRTRDEWDGSPVSSKRAGLYDHD